MLVVVCNLGLVGGLLHNGVTFAFAWGVFPVRSVFGWMLLCDGAKTALGRTSLLAPLESATCGLVCVAAAMTASQM